MKHANLQIDDAMLAALAEGYPRLRAELGRWIVGQHDAIEQMVICTLAGGHAQLVGVPGLAKTLLVQSLATCLGLRFRRIQFTPDLMPADILGTEVLQEDPATHERRFRFLPGPVFTHLLLADEINRTPPRTQAALLETMQERQVSVGGITHPIELPFLVLATRNPIEQEGTYPLPEAQLDRFLLEIRLDYPTADEEAAIVARHSGQPPAPLQPVWSRELVLAFQNLVRNMPVAESIMTAAAQLVRATRPQDPAAPPAVRQWLAWGAGPRATLNLVMAAKARALLHGQYTVGRDDLAALAEPILRHRLVLNFAAQTEGVTVEQIVNGILNPLRS